MLISIHISTKPYNVTVVQVYALTSTLRDSKVEEFRQQLDKVSKQKGILLLWSSVIGTPRLDQMPTSNRPKLWVNLALPKPATGALYLCAEPWTYPNQYPTSSQESKDTATWQSPGQLHIHPWNSTSHWGEHLDRCLHLFWVIASRSLVGHGLVHDQNWLYPAA